MRLNRIFCEGPLTVGGSFALPSAGAYHVARVLRMREGAPLVVFDGSGSDYHAEIAHVEGDKVTVQLRSQSPNTAESPLRITLVQGISRSERMDWTLQKATELGVGAVAPVLTSRSDDPIALAALVRLARSDAERERAFAEAFDANPFSLELVRQFQNYRHGDVEGDSTGARAQTQVGPRR